jgi:hypothetical protein
MGLGLAETAMVRSMGPRGTVAEGIAVILPATVAVGIVVNVTCVVEVGTIVDPDVGEATTVGLGLGVWASALLTMPRNPKPTISVANVRNII